jgi:hypothetical protein
MLDNGDDDDKLVNTRSIISSQNIRSTLKSEDFYFLEFNPV